MDSSSKVTPIYVKISVELANLYFLKNTKGPPWAILERIIKIRELDVLSIISRSAKANCISKEALESSFQALQLRLFQNIAPYSLRAPNRLSPKHLLKNHSKSMVF